MVIYSVLEMTVAADNVLLSAIQKVAAVGTVFKKYLENFYYHCTKQAL
jgi:hypothetical protein